MATGPSLTPEDVAFCRCRAKVIAINDAHRLAPWADVLYSSDRLWWPHHKGVPSFAGPKYGIGSVEGKRNPFAALPDIAVLRNTGHGGLETDPSGLRHGKNSGYAAINLAVHFGAARIVLLGYDMGWTGGKAHFFGNHPPGLTQREDLFHSFIRLFGTMVEPLKALGVEVINCSRRTRLHVFPQADLCEVFTSAEVHA